MRPCQAVLARAVAADTTRPCHRPVASGQTKLSVNALEGQSPLGHSRVGETQHSWKLHVDDFIPHRIQHQLGDRMKLELEHDIASMCFCRFYCHVQHHGDLLGSLALAQELQSRSLTL